VGDQKRNKRGRKSAHNQVAYRRPYAQTHKAAFLLLIPYHTSCIVLITAAPDKIREYSQKQICLRQAFMLSYTL